MYQILLLLRAVYMNWFTAKILYGFHAMRPHCSRLNKHWHLHHVWFILHKRDNLSWIQTPHTTVLGPFYLRFKTMKKKSYFMHAMYYWNHTENIAQQVKNFWWLQNSVDILDIIYWGRRFTLRIDHNSLVRFMRFKNTEGQLARWLEELAQFDMKIIHRPGKLHGNSDGMRRVPDTLI